ncbi:hypothetical protein [Oceanibaculum pacificum]|uniref:Lysozyme inhibitor LprI N-terminal domain-containing protein n=1 Tax=Oceanibaculum pacificum TaxID=580166 RepID=A0A154W346_9PROT|nr:hypothetical protein [Oceanibaculum pacificum]KZD07948.1 hypothetical protein AUP43_09135 [Oceanibaculum pacificum]
MYSQSWFVAAAVAATLLPGIAAASDCSERAKELLVEAEQADQRVVDDKAKVVLQTKNEGTKDVTGATDAAMPRDSWIADRNSRREAIVIIESAIKADEEGKTDSCRQLLTDAETMLMPPGSEEKAPAKATQ